MPGRQRLRRGVRHAPAAARVAAQLDLGGRRATSRRWTCCGRCSASRAALNAFLQEVGKARGADHRLDAAIKDLLTELADLDGIEARARRLVERIALVLQGSLLVRFAPPEVADAFCASRLGGDGARPSARCRTRLDLASVRSERAEPGARSTAGPAGGPNARAGPLVHRVQR